MSVRTERYTIRPFLGLESADAVLNPVRLKIDDTEYEAGSLVLPDDALLTGALQLIMPGSADDLRRAVEETKVPEVDCALAVFATANGLRTSQVLFRRSLNLEDFPDALQIDRDEAPLILQNKSGFKITLAIALLHDLQPQFLRPHAAGTWLARRDFRLTPERNNSIFSPEPLNEATRAYLGLPEGTLSYVDVPDTVINCDSLADEVKVYLDEETLNTLLRNPSDPMSRQLQTELAATTLNVIAQSMIRAIQAEAGIFRVTEAEIGGYARVSEFFKTLASRLSRDLGTVISLAHEPDRLRAEIQSVFGLRGLTERALKEG